MLSSTNYFDSFKKNFMQFRYDIQGLRALAVLFVLIFHLNKDWLPGGFIGVDMFFVISGYLISSIILSKKSRGTFSFKDFYISRIKRIVPAYYVFLIITTILTSFIYFAVDASKYRVALFWSALFNSNNYFAALDNYFGAASAEHPLLHTWTLAIEMQFYFFLPLMIILFSFKRSKFLFILLTIVLLAYASYNIITLGNKDAMYFSLLARTPEFFVGVLLNYFNFEITDKKRLPNILGFSGLFLLLISLIFLKETSSFPGLTALMPCIGTCLILISKNSVLNDVISRKPFVFIGELSYSIYLWHWPVLALYRYANGEYIISNYLHMALILIVIFILSWLSFTYIESSFRHKGLDKKFVISFSLIIILLGISAFSIKKINSKVSKIPVEFSSPEAHGLDSHGSTYEIDETRDNQLPIDTILLIGDSHALTMKSYLELLGTKHDFSFGSVTNDRFPPISGINLDDIPFQYQSRHEELSAITSNKIENSKIIILARAWDIEIPSFEKALKDLIENLNPSQHLIVFYDYPRVNANPIKIIRQLTKKTSSNFQWKVVTRAFPSYVRSLANDYNNVHLLDFSDHQIFEDAPFYNDTIMYYDAGHLNKFGSKKYALATEKEFMSLMLKLR